jgi:hypothetical protein
MSGVTTCYLPTGHLRHFEAMPAAGELVMYHASCQLFEPVFDVIERQLTLQVTGSDAWVSALLLS